MKNKEKTEKKPRNFKKFKYGSMSAIVVVLVVAIVVVINVITGMLMNRYPLKFDLTSDKRFELCDETIEALKTLDKDVEIGVTYPKDTLLQYNYYQMIPEILERYSIYAKDGSGSVEIRYFDVNEDPDIVAKYNQYYTGTISAGAMVVYCEEEERAEVLSISGMISSSSSSSYYSTSSDASYSFTGENSITSAILNVTDANPVRAGFLINMGEDSYVFGESSSIAYAISSYENLLAKNGYDCTELDIQSDEITPDDYDLIVIPAPFYDFNEDIIDDLEEFLYNGGSYGKNIVYIAHPTQTSENLPNITEFLAKRSLKVEDSIIKDYTTAVGASLYASSYEAYPSALVSIADSDSVGTLTSESLPIAVPDSRCVTILDKNTDYVMTEILTTADTAALLSLDDQTLAEDTASYTVAAKATYQHQNNFDIEESSVMVIGSAFMLDPILIQYNTTYNNSNVVLNMTNVICSKDSGIIIPDKTLEDNVVALTSTQQRRIRNIVIFGIPLIVVAIGAVVFIRRRNR